MSFLLVATAYGTSIGISLFLLYHFRAKAWYWHVLSVALAFTIGFAPLPNGWAEKHLDLLIGFAFLFLLLWGIAAPLYRGEHHRHV